VVVKSLSYILLSMVPDRCETRTFVHTSVCFLFCLFVLSFLVWFFLWLLTEEVLTLLFFFHCENGDFSILMKDMIYQTQVLDFS